MRCERLPVEGGAVGGTEVCHCPLSVWLTVQLCVDTGNHSMRCKDGCIAATTTYDYARLNTEADIWVSTLYVAWLLLGCGSCGRAGTDCAAWGRRGLKSYTY